MTPAILPQVWFEREVPPGLAPRVEAVATILGPGTSDAAKAEGIVAGVGFYDAAFMHRTPGLRVIARTGIGYDRVDISEATRRGIAVCNTPNANTVPTAEHATILLLLVARRFKWLEREVTEGAGDLYLRSMAIELHGKTLGLVGFGRIARHLANIADGFGMHVTAYDPFLPESAFSNPVMRSASLEGLLASADFVSLHVPLTDQSRGMFNAETFTQMKPGAAFINTARGGLVDSEDLVAALDSGHLVGAGLDVTDPEPLPSGHILMGRDDVVITPHIAAATVEGKLRAFTGAFDQIMEVLNGNRPESIVNPEVWD